MSKDSAPPIVDRAQGGLSRILMRSHLRVASVGILILLIGLVATIYMRNVARQLVEEGQPRYLAISDCRMGVKDALASLRGWMAVADPNFKADRRNAWNGKIYPALERLEALAKTEDTETLQVVASIRRELHELEEWQWYVEDATHSPGNHPVRFMFNERISPLFVEIFSRSSVLIDIEAESASENNRKQLLKYMADFRGFIASSQHNFRRYADSLEPVQKTHLLANRKRAIMALADVNAGERLMGPDQLDQLRLLNEEVELYLSMSAEVFKIADHRNEGVAQSWLEQECIPRGRRVMASLAQLADAQNQRMLVHTEAVNRISRLAPFAFGGLLVLMMGTAYVVSRRGSDPVTRRVGTLVAASAALAEGELKEDVPVEGSDELSLLAGAFNRMRASLLERESDLRDKEEESRLIIETASDGIVIINEQGIIQLFNPAAEALFGYRMEEVIGQNVNMLMPTPHHEAHDGYLKNYLDSGIAKIIDIGREVEGLRKDGQRFTAHLAISEMRIKGVRYFSGILTDLSEMKKIQQELDAEKELLETQYRIQAQLVSLNDCMRGEPELKPLCHRVLQFIVEHADAQMGAIYVVDDMDPDLLQRKATHAIPPKNTDTTRVQMGEGLVGQVAQSGESLVLTEIPTDYFHLESATGSRPPTQITIQPLSHDDEVVAVLELATMGAFPPAFESFMRRATGQLGIGINAVRANQKMTRLFEQTRQQSLELKDQQEELRSINEELEEQAQVLKASQLTLQNQQEELQVVNEELEEQKEALEAKNQQVERFNLDLEKKAEELAEASRYKSEFLANMSHELRTPLNSLLILSHLLSSNKPGNLDDKQVEYASTIHKSGSDLLTLINDILDLSKVEAGHVAVHWSPCGLSSLLEQLSRQFDPLAANKNLAFLTTLNESLPESFSTDPQRLEQILRNLASNALKFTSEGSITIEIDRPTEAEADDLHRLKLKPDAILAFRVRDTGIGIPEEKQQVIFESFQQVDGGISRKYGGTGLGLSISREFASLLGGEIQIESAAGSGSCFKLFLPELPSPEETPIESTEAGVAKDTLIDFEDPNPLPAHPESVQDDLEELTPGDNTLLVIEDDADFANILGDLGKAKGFKRLIACDGITGLHYALKYRPQAILLDVNLPGIDGVSLLARLKENPDTRDIPVHFMTGRDDMEDFSSYGAVGLLKKPVSTEALLETLESLAGARPEGRKKVLVVDGNDAHRKNLVDLIAPSGATEIEVHEAVTVAEAERKLADASFDCMILDFDLNGEGRELALGLLENIHEHDDYSHPPVILHAPDDLTASEEKRLNQFADRIVIKGARSPERLLDEATLFLHEVRAQLTDEQKASLRSLQTRESELDGRTIMIVDDDMRNAFALNSVLEEQGLHVIIRKNGQEALDLLATDQQVDMVLMDIMMPVLDGYQTMQQIRAQDRFKQLPIIALTAKAMKDDRNRCLEAGANDYLAKPVDVDRLLSLIHVWIQQGVAP